MYLFLSGAISATSDNNNLRSPLSAKRQDCFQLPSPKRLRTDSSSSSGKKGEDRIGLDWMGQDRIGLEWMGQDRYVRIRQDLRGQDCLDWMGKEGLDQTGQICHDRMCQEEYDRTGLEGIAQKCHNRIGWADGIDISGLDGIG